MGKRLFSVLLLSAILIMVLATSAFAGDKIHPHDVAACNHCICGGSASGIHDHACQAAEWKPIPAGTVNFSTLEAGNYYLTSDLQITDYTNMTKDLSICLNGYSVTSTDYRIFGNTRAGMTLNLCDCSGKQDATGKWSWDGTFYGPDYIGSSKAYGAILYTHAGSVVNIFGGNYIGGANQANGSCFVVANDGASATGISGATNTTPGVESTLNIYNGYICGKEVKSNGGTIQLYHTAVLNIHGGTITGGTAPSGGNISSGSNCVINITGGVISDGTATSNGGNIAYGKLTMSGGTVTGGTAKNGGNIYAPTTVKITGGSITEGNTDKNGGIYLAASTTGSISGDPVITGNQRSNVFFVRNCPVTIGQLTDGANVGLLYADTWHKVTVNHTPTADVANYLSSDSPEAYFTFSGTTMRQTAKSQEYKETISGADYFDNTLDEALPMTVIHKLMTDHFASDLPEGKTEKKAIVIGYDAFRTDALEFVTGQNSGVFAVAQDGGLYHAFAGGEYGGETQQMTVTSVGWTSMFTGYWSRTHGITANHTSVLKPGIHSYHTQLAEAGYSVLLHGDSISKEKDAGGNYERFFPEHWVNEIAYQEAQGLDITYSGVTEPDTSINANALLEIIGQTEMPDVIWYYQAEPDNQGHAKGWGGHIPEYVTGVQVTDSNGYDIYTAIKARPTYAQEDWLVIVTTDHGGYLTQHGEHSAQERSTWIATNKAIDYTDEAYLTYEREVEVEGDHFHCACGTGLSNNKGEHSCEEIPWSPWSDPYSLPNTAGNYYLTCDVDLSNATDKTNLVSVVQRLCLNGHTITGPKSLNTIWWVGRYFSLCDCMGTGTINATEDVTGSVLHVFNSTTVSQGMGGTFEMFGGKITSSGTGKGGGIIFLGNSGTNSCKFNFYGGTLEGGSSTSIGGGVTMHGDVACIMNMYGGTVKNCTGGTYGGGINISEKSEFNMYGGSIENCTSGTAAGNLYVYGLAHIYGGTISGGVSAEGGNISVGGKGTLYQYGGLITKGGYRGSTVTSTRGGNITVFGQYYFYGGTVSDGKAVNYGGNIGTYNSSVFEMAKTADSVTAPLASGGEAKYGGNISLGGSSGSNVITTFNIYDGATITGGIATGNGEGGNLHLGLAKYFVNMYGGTISDGGSATSTSQGGNLFLYGTFNMYGGTISGGKSKTDGGNISGWSSFKLNLLPSDLSTTAPRIIDGTAGRNGGNVILRGTAPEMNMSCGVISGGTGTAGSGIYFSAGTLGLSGTANVTGNTGDDIYLTTGKTLTASGLNTGAGFGITAQTPGTFATGTTSADKKYFTSNQADYVVVASGSELALTTRIAAQAGDNTYGTLQDAINSGATWVKLLMDIEENVVISGDVYLDLAGFTLTGDVSGDGTLYGMDSATDGYTTDGMGAIIGAVTCNVEDNFKTSVTGSVRRYLAIEGASGYTFHRIYLGITHMTLKPGFDGVGYKAVFGANGQVLDMLEAYGITLWVGEEGEKHSFEKAVGSNNISTLKLILENFDVENYSQTRIYGQVYMKTVEGTVIESSVYSYTLQELVEAVAANADSYTQKQIADVRAFISRYEAVMKDWKIDPLKETLS